MCGMPVPFIVFVSDFIGLVHNTVAILGQKLFFSPKKSIILKVYDNQRHEMRSIIFHDVFLFISRLNTALSGQILSSLSREKKTYVMK